MCARSTGAVMHVQQETTSTVAVCTAGHKEVLKGQQTAATGRPAAGARSITAPRRSQTPIHSQSYPQRQNQAGDLLTACWVPHAAAASHRYPSGVQQVPYLQPHAKDAEPPPCMSCLHSRCRCACRGGTECCQAGPRCPVSASQRPVSNQKGAKESGAHGQTESTV